MMGTGAYHWGEEGSKHLPQKRLCFAPAAQALFGFVLFWSRVAVAPSVQTYQLCKGFPAQQIDFIHFCTSFQSLKLERSRLSCALQYTTKLRPWIQPWILLLE